MKRLFPGVCVAMFALVGCGKDAEFEEFIKLNDATVKEVVEAGKKDGPDAATKAFDAKKGELKTKYDAIKEARGFQVKAETKTKFEKSVLEATTEVCALQLKELFNKENSDKYSKLCDAYTDILK